MISRTSMARKACSRAAGQPAFCFTCTFLGPCFILDGNRAWPPLLPACLIAMIER